MLCTGYLRKYHEESTNVSMVSVSRLAGCPQLGQGVEIQSSAANSGDRP
jgi:hypothetical protein